MSYIQNNNGGSPQPTSPNRNLYCYTNRSSISTPQCSPSPSGTYSLIENPGQQNQNSPNNYQSDPAQNSVSPSQIRPESMGRSSFLVNCEYYQSIPRPPTNPVQVSQNINREEVPSPTFGNRDQHNTAQPISQNNQGGGNLSSSVVQVILKEFSTIISTC